MTLKPDSLHGASPSVDRGVQRDHRRSRHLQRSNPRLVVVKQVLGDRGQKSPVALPRHLGGREFGSTSVARRTNRKNSTDTSSTRKTPRREGTTRLSGPCRPCGVGPRVADPREHTTPRFSLTIPSTTTDPNGHVQDC